MPSFSERVLSGLEVHERQRSVLSTDGECVSIGAERGRANRLRAVRPERNPDPVADLEGSRVEEGHGRIAHHGELSTMVDERSGCGSVGTDRGSRQLPARDIPAVDVRAATGRRHELIEEEERASARREEEGEVRIRRGFRDPEVVETKSADDSEGPAVDE